MNLPECVLPRMRIARWLAVPVPPGVSFIVELSARHPGRKLSTPASRRARQVIGSVRAGDLRGPVCRKRHLPAEGRSQGLRVWDCRSRARVLERCFRRAPGDGRTRCNRRIGYVGSASPAVDQEQAPGIGHVASCRSVEKLPDRVRLARHRLPLRARSWMGMRIGSRLANRRMTFSQAGAASAT